MPPLALKKDVHPSDTPKITTFTEVPQDLFDKLSKHSTMKSCLLDPWPTFLTKESSDILLPSMIKLVNCPHMDGCFPDGFKTPVVSPLIEKATLPAIVLYLALVSYLNWLNKWLLSNC